jgi:hypothetical protein
MSDLKNCWAQVPQVVKDKYIGEARLFSCVVYADKVSKSRLTMRNRSTLTGIRSAKNTEGRRMDKVLEDLKCGGTSVYLQTGTMAVNWEVVTIS